MILLWFAFQKFGVTGVAAVWSVRVAIDAVLLFVASGAGFLLLRKLVVPTAILSAALVLVISIAWQGTTRWLLGVVLLAAMVIWAWMNVPAEESLLRLLRLRRHTSEVREPGT